jgi:hypothetical protein
LRSLEFQKEVKRNKVIFLFGRFYRDYENFEKHQAAIRNYFTPRVDVVKNVADLISKARQGADLLIGVHIRRGDYKEFAGGKYYYDQQAYYDKMKEILVENHRKIHFIICSNEAINVSIFEGLTFFQGTGQLVEDMYALAGCDFIMGPPSTFTRWASFYGRKPIYAIEDINDKADLKKFVMLPKEKLFNF